MYIKVNPIPSKNSDYFRKMDTFSWLLALLNWPIGARYQKGIELIPYHFCQSSLRVSQVGTFNPPIFLAEGKWLLVNLSISVEYCMDFWRKLRRPNWFECKNVDIK